MSVRNETYLIFGVNITDKDSNILDDLCEKHSFPWCGRNSKGTIGILYGGMNDLVAFFGKVIEVKSEEGEYFSQTISIKKLLKESPQYKTELEEFINNNKIEGIPLDDDQLAFWIIDYFH